MKRLLIGTLMLLTLIMSGCGSDTTVIITPTHPTITAVRYSKDSVNNLILGSIDFVAPDVDLDTMAITTENFGGQVVSQTITDLSVFNGVASGTILFTIDYASFPADTYFFFIDVSDLNGALSNEVSRSFSVP